MPAANQAPLGVTRIRSTGLPHSAGGAGISTSLIRKSPLAASGTPVMFVLNWVKGGVASQISVAKTLALPFVPMVLPPPSSRPRPSTRIRPSTFTSALKSEITQIWPAELTPRTVFRITSGKLPSGLGVPATFATGISPIAPLNLTNVSSAITDEAKDPPMRTIRIDANKLFFITSPSFPLYQARHLRRAHSLACDRRLSCPVSGVVGCLCQLVQQGKERRRLTDEQSVG